jgi:hypothetical protein
MMAPGYEREEWPRSERLLAALAEQTLGSGAATCAFLRVGPLGSAGRGQSRPVTAGDRSYSYRQVVSSAP